MHTIRNLRTTGEELNRQRSLQHKLKKAQREHEESPAYLQWGVQFDPEKWASENLQDKATWDIERFRKLVPGAGVGFSLKDLRDAVDTSLVALSLDTETTRAAMVQDAASFQVMLDHGVDELGTKVGSLGAAITIATDSDTASTDLVLVSDDEPDWGSDENMGEEMGEEMGAMQVHRLPFPPSFVLFVFNTHLPFLTKPPPCHYTHLPFLTKPPPCHYFCLVGRSMQRQRSWPCRRSSLRPKRLIWRRRLRWPVVHAESSPGMN